MFHFFIRALRYATRWYFLLTRPANRHPPTDNTEILFERTNHHFHTSQSARSSIQEQGYPP